MTDRERVVNRLKRLIKTAHHDAMDFVYVTVGTAGVIVRLLEEQERVRLFVDENGKITPLNTPAIVRCRDCEHYRADGYCTYNNHDQLNLEWFCADGRRSEE